MFLFSISCCRDAERWSRYSRGRNLSGEMKRYCGAFVVRPVRQESTFHKINGNEESIKWIDQDGGKERRTVRGREEDGGPSCRSATGQTLNVHICVLVCVSNIQSSHVCDRILHVRAVWMWELTMASYPPGWFVPHVEYSLSATAALSLNSLIQHLKNECHWFPEHNCFVWSTF